jgi:steroid delta-isomerase-like uncharacterized protein
MKIFHHYIVITGILCSGYSSHSQTTNTKRIAAEWINILNKHDTVALTDLYSDSVKLESPNWEGVKTGKSVVKETYSRYFASTPDMQQEVSDIMATDSVVVIEYTFHGTLLNPEKNTPEYMRGKKYKLSACTVMSIRKGKITSQQTYFDQVSFLRQVGFFDQK